MLRPSQNQNLQLLILRRSFASFLGCNLERKEVRYKQQRDNEYPVQ